MNGGLEGLESAVGPITGKKKWYGRRVHQASGAPLAGWMPRTSPIHQTAGGNSIGVVLPIGSTWLDRLGFTSIQLVEVTLNTERHSSIRWNHIEYETIPAMPSPPPLQPPWAVSTEDVGGQEEITAGARKRFRPAMVTYGDDNDAREEVQETTTTTGCLRKGLRPRRRRRRRAGRSWNEWRRLGPCLVPGIFGKLAL